jgi:hypothetical protein
MREHQAGPLLVAYSQGRCLGRSLPKIAEAEEDMLRLRLRTFGMNTRCEVVLSYCFAK